MTPEQYLISLITGMEMGSDIPVQLSELKLLLSLMHAHAAKVCAEKEAANLELAKLASDWMDIATAKDTEIERHVQEVDASRNRIDALTQVVAELVEGLTAIVDSPASRPQSKTVAMLAIARAALKETK